MNADFCSCEDYKCPLNPKNHDKGCTPCISKNLKNGEIPTCFFKSVNEDTSNVKKFDVQGFVKHYAESKKSQRD